MASSRAGRVRNPTSKVSADVNGDFSSLLPYQKRQVLEAAAGAQKSTEQLEAANAPQLLASSPTDNGQNLTPNPGHATTTTSQSSSHHPPSPSAISDNEEIGPSGGDEASDVTRMKINETQKRKQLAAADLGETYI